MSEVAAAAPLSKRRRVSDERREFDMAVLPLDSRRMVGVQGAIAQADPHQPTRTFSTAAAMRNSRRSWPLRAISIKPTGRPVVRGSGSEIAHKSKKLARPVLRRSRKFLVLKMSGSATLLILGATIGVVGMTSASRSA